MNSFTRRRILNALAGLTTAAALGDAVPAAAQSSDAESIAEREALIGEAFDHFQRFIRLSAVLTGIDGKVLAPASVGSKDASGQLESTAADPTQAYKLAYFNLAFKDPVYPSLLSQFEAALTPAVRGDPVLLGRLAVTLLHGADGVKELARSIIMAWYFGVWYEWLPKAKPRFTVVSAAAYTQGWVWRIAQAHAPGWSNLRFGYWAFAPAASSDPKTIRLKAIAT
jgi:hypothetical protein